MPFRVQSLDELLLDHEAGSIVRVSRVVSKEGRGHELVDKVRRAVASSPDVEKAFVGTHHAPNGRAVVCIITVWDSPERLRAAVNPSAPIGYDQYAELVETWSLEYFDEELEVARKNDEAGPEGPAPFRA